MTRYEYSYVRFLSNQAGCLFTLVERICAFEILQNSVLVVSEKFKPASPPGGLDILRFLVQRKATRWFVLTLLRRH